MSPVEKFLLLCRKSLEIGWPQQHREDLLTADREMLYQRDPDTFVWLVRPTGTWLLLPDNPCSLQILCYLLEEGDSGGHKAFLYEKGSLVKVEINNQLWDWLVHQSRSVALQEFARLATRDNTKFWSAAQTWKTLAAVARELDRKHRGV